MLAAGAPNYSNSRYPSGCSAGDHAMTPLSPFSSRRDEFDIPALSGSATADDLAVSIFPPVVMIEPSAPPVW
jgi:hypothetical protein